MSGQLKLHKLLARRESGRVTPRQFRHSVEPEYECTKIYFPTFPAMDVVSDAILKVIKTAMPGTSHAFIDLRACPSMNFDPNAKSLVFVVFVPFGQPSNANWLSCSVDVGSDDPTMHIWFVNKVVSCYVYYRVSNDEYHYAKALRGAPTPVHVCSAPLQEKIYESFNVVVDIARLVIDPLHDVSAALRFDEETRSITTPERLEPDREASYDAQFRTIVDLARLRIAVKVVPCTIPEGRSIEIESILDEVGAILRLDCIRGTTMRDWVYRWENRIY